MGLFERHQFLSFAKTILVVMLFLGQVACDSTCPNGFENKTASSGTISYPSSGDYGKNETKCWVLEAPEPYVGIGFRYTRFEIEVCKDCKCDYMHISDSYNSLQQGQGKSCGRFSVSHLEYRIRSLSPVGGGGSRKLFLRFVSDDTVHHKGFSFEFFAASSIGVGRVNYLNATEDETIEFGTPKVGIESYPNNYEEQWYLFAPKGGHVQIDFDTFELEKSENCKNDYVEVREAYYYLDNGEKKVGGQYGPILSGHKCGSTKPSSIQSKNNMVWVHFRSDSNSTTVYKGFKASFKAVSGQGKLFVGNPLTLLFLSALLMIASKNSVF